MSKKLKQIRKSLITGVTIFLMGIVFLLDNLNLIDVAVTWPIIPMGAAIGLIFDAFLRKSLFIWTKILFGTGIFLLMTLIFLDKFNILDLTIFWPIIPLLIGIGLVVYFFNTKADN